MSKHAGFCIVRLVWCYKKCNIWDNVSNTYVDLVPHLHLKGKNIVLYSFSWTQMC